MLDCFFAVPSRPLGEMEEIVIDFGDASTQVFHVGEASVAVPGLLAGLEHAHRRFGRLPWPDLAAPALELAGAGVDVSEAQAFLHRILSAILQRDEGGRHIYGSPGRLATDAYVATLESVRDRGAQAVAELLPELEDDLAAYEVAEREPAPDDLPRPGGARDTAAVARRHHRHARARAPRARGHARRQSARDPVRLRERAARTHGGHDPHLRRRRARRRRRAVVDARLRLGRLPRAARS